MKNNRRSGSLVKITEVSEYTNFPSKCSTDSYYQCLTNLFDRFVSTQVPNKTINGMECQFKNICLPFSLPSAKQERPLCDNQMDRVCFTEVLMDFKPATTKECKKLCHVKDFKYKIDPLSKKYGYSYITGIQNPTQKWINTSWKWYGYDPTHSYIMEYSFEIDKYSIGAEVRRRDHRSEEPYKTVHTEYLIVSDMALVGNMGGMLGLFIGFSFLGISEWIVDSLEKAYVTKGRNPAHSHFKP